MAKQPAWSSSLHLLALYIPLNLLQRYILIQFAKNILLLVMTFIALYILIDFFEKIDNFVEKGKPMTLVAHFFLLSIPFILEQMGPVCILLAGVVTLGVLNHSNELIALKSGGISLKQIAWPLLLAGAVASLLLLSLSQFVVPKTVSQTNAIWERDVRGRVPLGIYRHGRYYYHGENRFYSFARPIVQHNDFTFFSYATWNDTYDLQTLIAAENTSWLNNTWFLYTGQMQRLAEDASFHTEIFSMRTFPFPEKPTDFFIPQFRNTELSLLEMYQDALRSQHHSEEEQARAWSAFYGRISYTLLGLPLLLLGLPMLLVVYRKWGRDLSLAVPVSCGMAFVCWGIWVILQSLSKAAYLNPLAAALAVHLVVASLGLFLLLREDT
jgi:lipopolysaccharide export system permease protein